MHVHVPVVPTNDISSTSLLIARGDDFFVCALYYLWVLYDFMPLFLSSILSPFDCLLLDKFGSVLVSQSSLEVEPLFEEEPTQVLVSRLRSMADAHLAFFFDSLIVVARSQILLWIVSPPSHVNQGHIPDSLDLILTCLHVDVDIPEI